MQTYLWIALGSALGGVGRYWCTTLAARLLDGGFPWGTLLINVAGSMVIGYVATAAGPDGRWLLPLDGRQFLMVGVCGGFTTFSAFSLQTLMLLREGDWALAGGYIAASVLLCVLGVWFGHLLADAFSTVQGV